MKTIFNIFVFALAMVLVQACGSKSKENASEGTDVAATQLAATEKAAQDKKEAAAKREEAQKERVRLADERRAAAEAYYKDPSGDLVYNKAEVAPSFPGGKKALNKYFSENLKYPAEAESKDWDGTVYVDFIIGKDGQVRDAVVTDETDEAADQSLKDEAIRVVMNMPRWTPGTQLGKPVHAKFNLPVAFKIV